MTRIHRKFPAKGADNKYGQGNWEYGEDSEFRHLVYFDELGARFQTIIPTTLEAEIAQADEPSRTMRIESLEGELLWERKE